MKKMKYSIWKLILNNESLMKEIDEINNDMKNIHLNVMSKSLFL
jgi:hypothetical protein